MRFSPKSLKFFQGALALRQPFSLSIVCRYVCMFMFTKRVEHKRSHIQSSLDVIPVAEIFLLSLCNGCDKNITKAFHYLNVQNKEV